MQESEKISVKNAYKLLALDLDSEWSSLHALIWNKIILLKVLLFTWRLFCNSPLIQKYNLARHGILNTNSLLYVYDCGGEKSCKIYFFSVFFSKVCNAILEWLGFCSVLTHYAYDHVNQFFGLRNGSRAKIYWIWLHTFGQFEKS